MNSSISHFSWVGLAVAGFVAIESAVAWWAPRPDALRNNLLELSFAKPELVQRAFVFEKVQQFDDLKPDIIQVGDSSGLHAVQSPIVESYLGGRSFLNLSVASNLGFEGYLALADRMMQRSGSVKLLVLYFTSSPRPALLTARDLMGPDLQRELVNPFNSVFHTPSLGLRREVSDRVFYLNGRLNQLDRPLIANPGYFMLRDIIASSGGWSRETDIPDDHIVSPFQMIRDVTPAVAASNDMTIVKGYRDLFAAIDPVTFDWRSLSRRTYMEIVFDQYLALARRHGAHLVIAANPYPEAFRPQENNGGTTSRGGMDLPEISKEMRAYANKHTDVSLLDYDYWPDNKFSVFSHVGTPYSVESSHRLGRFLADIAQQLPSSSTGQPTYVAPKRVVLDMGASPTVYGFSDAERAGDRRFRRIRQGRYEALAYARVNPEAQQELRVSVLNAPDDAVLRDIAIGLYGSAATRLPDIQDDGKLILRFSLPSEATRRFGGWLELTLSTRGATAWQTNALDPAATGPQLQIERMDLVSR